MNDNRFAVALQWAKDRGFVHDVSVCNCPSCVAADVLCELLDTTPVTFAEVEDVIMENVSTAKIHRNPSDGSFTVTNCRVVIRTRADLAAVRRAVR